MSHCVFLLAVSEDRMPEARSLMSAFGRLKSLTLMQAIITGSVFIKLSGGHLLSSVGTRRPYCRYICYKGDCRT